MSAFRILAVCLGNICRSPMAEAVLRARFDASSLDVLVSSAGTSGAHAGEAADPRAERTLRAAGYELVHVAREMQPDWLAEHDLVVVMDEQNLRNTIRLAERHGIDTSHIRLMRSFDGQAVAAGDTEVPDPWYGGEDGFAEVLEMLERASEGIVEHVRSPG